MIQTNSILKPQLVALYFLRCFAEKLKVPTVTVHLPVAGNLAPQQAGAFIKGGSLPINAQAAKGAEELAESVNSSVRLTDASHVSFEELEHPPVDNWHIATDNATGISVRMLWAPDITTGEIVTRFEVCFRLWRLVSPA